MTLLFVTRNKHKFGEAESILKGYGVKIEHASVSIPEERGEDCEAIAASAARAAYKGLKRPLFVEDSGLFIESLNGFPGTYSAWAFKKLGADGILKLMTGTVKRGATFVTAIAYADKGGIRTFVGTCQGSVSKKKRGSKGFAYDVVFVPGGEDKTFAEDEKLKALLSHRRDALEKFAKWLKKKKETG
ncbi:MAG: XTP/dITP diphosphatase [Candidatus Micrarchaeota archaeon]